MNASATRAMDSVRDDVDLLGEAVQAAFEARRLGQASFPRAFRRALFAVRAGRFRPMEALRLGLLSDECAPDALSCYVSKRSLSAQQTRLNPADLYWTTEDKWIFYGLCKAHGLPHPSTFGALLKHHSGRIFDEIVPGDRGGWARALHGLCPNEFVVKPSRGRHGLEVYVVERHGKGFVVNGEYTNPDALADVLWRGDYQVYLVQERYCSHRDLSDWAGSSSLHTLRPISYLAPNGDVSLLMCTLRVARSGSPTDNYHYGLSGNFMTRICADSGEIEAVYLPGSPGRPMEQTDRHPASGRRLVGIHLPHWSQVRDLIFRGAAAFAPLRTVGWDVGITDDGPKLIEGNVRYDLALSNLLSSEARRLLRDGDNVRENAGISVLGNIRAGKFQRAQLNIR